MDARDILTYFDEDGEHDEQYLEAVQVGEWEVDHKYESQSTVYRHIPSGRYFDVIQTRSGSYYSDYEYLDSVVYEVQPVEYKAIKYVVVK
jgi:hypothetical protein